MAVVVLSSKYTYRSSGWSFVIWTFWYFGVLHPRLLTSRTRRWNLILSMVWSHKFVIVYVHMCEIWNVKAMRFLFQACKNSVDSDRRPCPRMEREEDDDMQSTLCFLSLLSLESENTQAHIDRIYFSTGPRSLRSPISVMSAASLLFLGIFLHCIPTDRQQLRRITDAHLGLLSLPEP